MNFTRSVLRPSLMTLIIAGLSTAAFVFIVSVVMTERRLDDLVSLNQWLARDIASQFSGVAAKSLVRAQKFGELVKKESGSFDASAQREFDADPSLKAVWVLDAVGAGPLQPIARLERDGFTVAETQTETVRRLSEVAIQQGSAARGIAPGVNAVALKLGDIPRTVLLFFDEALFARANGGPWGDKWLLMAPSADRTESVLVEATSELRDATNFPTFDEISRLVTAQTPAQERSEFTTEILASNGHSFQVSGVQTGAFGVIAVAITPLGNTVNSMGLLVKVAVGVTLSLTLLVMFLLMLRYRKPSRIEAVPPSIPEA